MRTQNSNVIRVAQIELNLAGLMRRTHEIFVSEVGNLLQNQPNSLVFEFMLEWLKAARPRSFSSP